MSWNKVLATHEEEQVLATGPWLGKSFPGVALPCRTALFRWVILRFGNKWTVAQVMDLGPWCHDDPYWVDGRKPRAELYKGQACPIREGSDEVATVPDGKGGFRPAQISNGAGIDLFPATANNLGLPLALNTMIQWQFIDPGSWNNE